MFPGSKVTLLFVRTSPDDHRGDLTVRAMESGLRTPWRMRWPGRDPTITPRKGGSRAPPGFGASATYAGGASGAVGLKFPITSANEPTLEAVGGSVQAYCFEVSLPNDASSDAQGLSASHTWTFDAESVTPEN